MKTHERHMTLLALAVGGRLDGLRKQGIQWRFDQAGGMDPTGTRHMGQIVVTRGQAAMILRMTSSDRIELWADGIGATGRTAGYPRERITAEFFMRAVAAFLEKVRTRRMTRMQEDRGQSDDRL